MEQRLYPKHTRSSLAETVANMEELLTKILVRMPARHLIRFKCVSKNWLSLISDLKFCDRHTLKNPNSSISAVFHHSSDNFSFIPFPPDHDPSGHNHISPHWNPFEVIGDQYGSIDIIHSCNGLFLCQPFAATSTSRSPYLVLNPTTNRFSTLVIPAISDDQNVETHIIGCSLAFDPSKSPHYKVICLETINGLEYCRGYRIQIYLSETQSWRLLNSCFTRQAHVRYEEGVYCNGAIHWVGDGCEMAYYPIDEEVVEFFVSPDHCYWKKCHKRKFRYFQENGGHLHLIDIYKPCLTKFEVLEMGRDYSGWFVKYNVDLDPLCTAFPNVPYGEFVVLFLDRDENEESMQYTPGKLISCDLKSKTFKSFELTTAVGSGETEGTGKTKATWPDDIVAIFCDIARKEVAKGNRPGTHFDKKGWENVVKAFNDSTGRDYTKDQLKNKWDSLKNDWKLWSSLLHQETGIGWDPVKKTIDASVEWWKSKIKSNPEYRKFRDVGINPEMMDIYDQMFKGSVALGQSVMIPLASIVGEEVLEDFEHDEDEVPDPVEDIQGRGKKRTTVERQTEGTKDKGVGKGANGKKGRVGGAAKLFKQIDRLVEVVESRSTATSIPTSAAATSIQEVMQVVATLPGAETGTKLWWFATELFCSQEKREMFSIMTDADLKLQFLILNQKKADPSFVM
uniref:F-box protein At5g07610-like n=1 Tax=Fragaria vesca subsp. vesca TaxID=101020 RepID=UPI0005C8C81A|nr:PREDICTED: F-box protein At5g07610-like [Fragaria vesca subsp. vesca]